MDESYTDAECLDALQDAADQLGQSPTQADYRSLGLSPGITILQERFGSWNDAKTAAGLTLCQHGRHLPWYHENADGYMEWVWSRWCSPRSAQRGMVRWSSRRCVLPTQSVQSSIQMSGTIARRRFGGTEILSDERVATSPYHSTYRKDDYYSK